MRVEQDDGRGSPPRAKGRSARGASRVGITLSRFERTRQKTANARRLRRTSTVVENKLWQKLRRRQLGAEFRRQHPVGPYVLDFYCPALRLAVKLDGGQHAQAGLWDARRDTWFAAHGVRTPRFWNSDVVENCAGVLERIVESIGELQRAGMTPTRRWRADLPLAGGGDPSSRQR